MKAALLAFLILALPALAGESTPTYRYTAELEDVSPDGGGYRLWFNIRKDGESYTVWQPTVDWNHAERPRFQNNLTRLKKENIYYELIFTCEMPRSKSFGYIDMGIVTKQTLQDLGNLSRSRVEGQPPSLPIAKLISIRPITQNEFLGVNPRIVKP